MICGLFFLEHFFFCFEHLPAGSKKKNVLFASSASPPRVLASQARDHDQTWRMYDPLSAGSSLPSLRAAGDLCLNVSLGSWEPDPFLYQLFFRWEMPSCSASRKVGTEMGQPPTSQARLRDTDHLRPSNLAARTLRQWSIHSSFVMIRGLWGEDSLAAMKCCVRKSRFFLSR